MKKILAMLLVAALTLTAFAGCGSKEGTEGSSKAPADLGSVYSSMSTEKQFIVPDDIQAVKSAEKLTIGLAMAYGVTTPFYKSLADAIKAEAEADGATVIMADCESDAQKQVSKLEAFIAQDVDGIIVLPADPNTAITLVLQKAYDAGIPVMTIDVPASEDAKYMASFTTDAYQLGYAVGEQLAKELLAAHPAGDIPYGLIGGTEGNPTPTARNQGMRDAIKEIDTEGRIKEAVFLYANAFTEESGLKTAENMLVAHPDLMAILGTCDAHVVGATAAAKRQGLDANIIMGGVDGSKAAMQIMKDGGPIKVLALNSPIDVGTCAARSMIAYLAGGIAPASKMMVIKGGVVTPDNVDQYIENAF
ncbi:MAG TPA: sugar ABC transporter substrate-binding protein [Bacillota bacterium]|nr:sugar ABC transporter substrate-binding protein [Bacillota bacterium]